MYFVGLFLMTIGIAISVKSNLGVSFRTIARHMGEKTSVVARRAQTMMESVRANRRFIAQRRLIMAGEAA